MFPADAQRLEIGHVLAPADRDFARNRRLSTAALVVVDERPPAGEAVEAGTEVGAVGPGAAVEDDDLGADSDRRLDRVGLASRLCGC